MCKLLRVVEARLKNVNIFVLAIDFVKGMSRLFRTVMTFTTMYTHRYINYIKL